MDEASAIREGLTAAGVEPAAVERFALYVALLLRWNARMNLTAARQADVLVGRHLAECIFAARQMPRGVKTLLDFGSGGGLPGIPIALCRPAIGVTLAESQGKKAAFLREAIRTLGLKAEVWAARVETMPAERVFDAVTLRAVDKMAAAVRAGVERVRPGGWLVVFTTRRTEAALDDLGGIRWQEAVALPGSEQGVLRTGRRVAGALKMLSD